MKITLDRGNIINISLEIVPNGETCWKEEDSNATKHVYQALREVVFGDIATTKESDINKINRNFRESLDNQMCNFIFDILHSDFEDGSSNCAIEFIERCANENDAVTFQWLNGLYGFYTDNPEVESGIVCCLASIANHYKNEDLVPIMVAALAHKSPSVNEAALALIEQIRSRECLKALKLHRLNMPLLEYYKEKLIEELTSELA